MSSKPFTFEEIETAKNNNKSLTISQTGLEAWGAVTEKFKNIEPWEMFYHKGNGVWSKRKGVKPPKNHKVQCVKAPKIKNKLPPKIPDVKPPSDAGLIPELKGGFNRGIKEKNRIEIFSIEDVMRCTDKDIIGFLPIYKRGVRLS